MSSEWERWDLSLAQVCRTERGEREISLVSLKVQNAAKCSICQYKPHRIKAYIKYTVRGHESAYT